MKKIRPVQEEVEHVLYIIIFELGWYASLSYADLMKSSFGAFVLIFGGCVPIYGLLKKYNKALMNRRKRKEVIARGEKMEGKIIGVVPVYQETRGTRGGVRVVKRYCLKVEVKSPQTGAIYEVKSHPYRLPVYRYVSSPYVSVYADESGWNYYIEDFVFKKNKNEPDIIEYHEYENEDNRLSRFVEIILLLLFIANLLDILFIYFEK